MFQHAQPVQLPAPEFPDVTDAQKRAYLVGYIRGGTKTSAAAAAKVSLRTGWNWRHDASDPAFLAAFRQADGIRGERMEDEAWRRGHDGWEEPVYQGGQLVGTLHKHSDTLLIFSMKGEMPGKYRERVEHSGPKGGPIPIAQVGRLNLYLPDNGRSATAP